MNPEETSAAASGKVERKKFYKADGMALFRREAVEHKTQKLFGNSALPKYLSHWLFISLVFTVSIFLMLIMIFGEYSKKSYVIGKVVPSEGVANVTSSVPGLIEDIMVSVGDEVMFNTPMFKLKLDIEAGDGTQGIKATLENLSSQMQIYETRRQNIKNQYSSLAISENLRLKILQSQYEHLQEEFHEIENQIDVNESLVRTMEKLFSQEAGSKLELDNAKEKSSRTKQQKAQLLRSLDQMRMDILESQRLIEDAPLQMNLKIGEINERALLVEKEIIELNRRSTQVISSSIEGKITSLIAIKGARVGSGELLASVISKESTFQAHLFLTSKDVAEIEIGEIVSVNIDSYPKSNFGKFDARVLEISGAEIPATNLGLSKSDEEYFYLVKCEFLKDQEALSAKGVALDAGMGLSISLVHKKTKLWKLALGLK